jgi:competence protein ComEA
MKRQTAKRIITLLLILVAIFFIPVAALCSDGIVSLNNATVEEIMAIEDIDIPEELAKAIVDYRNKNGKFARPEDLIKVPGMTQDFLEELNPILLNGDVVYDPDAEPALAPSKC